MQKTNALRPWARQIIFFKNPQIADLQSPFCALKMQISAPKFAHASKKPKTPLNPTKNKCPMTFCKSLISEKLLKFGKFTSPLWAIKTQIGIPLRHYPFG
jgi:hypothetical protein